LANIKSSQKKNRQRIVHEARNRAQKSAMRTAVKALRAAIAAKKPAEAKALLNQAVSLVDRAGRRGTIKKHTASRTVGRLTVAVNGIAK
jgi:small subunit ribosomal protein S20